MLPIKDLPGKRSCCNPTCDNILKEQGPILTFFKQFNALAPQIDKAIVEVSEDDHDDGMSAQFNILKSFDKTSSLLTVTIYCRKCKTICKYSD